MHEPLTLPFLMGWAAVFNPCGVAMLPATVAWLVGAVASEPHAWKLLWRGLGAGLGLAAGFTLVVAALAVVVHAAGVVLTPWLKPAMLVLGGGLLVAGGLLAMGYVHVPVDRWLRVERWRRMPNTSWLSLVVAGMAYGVAALSCTLPLFLAALLPAMSVGGAAAAGVVGAFGAGSATVLVGISEATLLARAAVLRFMRRVGPWLNPALGAVVAAAGGYLLYFWIWGPGHWIG